jgi:hypothetical protein
VEVILFTGNSILFCGVTPAAFATDIACGGCFLPPMARMNTDFLLSFIPIQYL